MVWLNNYVLYWQPALAMITTTDRAILAPGRAMPSVTMRDRPHDSLDESDRICTSLGAFTRLPPGAQITRCERYSDARRRSEVVHVRYLLHTGKVHRLSLSRAQAVALGANAGTAAICHAPVAGATAVTWRGDLAPISTR